jgi:hypothetical protein
VSAPGAPRAGASATRLEGQGALPAWILIGWHPTARRKAAEAALIPPNCPLCEEAYRDPIKTDCGHYFCADCVVPRYQHGSSEGRKCPLCAEHLNGSFTIAEDLSARLRDQFNAPSLDQVEARCPHVPRTAPSNAARLEPPSAPKSERVEKIPLLILGPRQIADLESEPSEATKEYQRVRQYLGEGID